MSYGVPQRKGVHLVGVGGMGMMPLAVGLAGNGWCVTGEDSNLPSDVAEILKSANVQVRDLEDFDIENLPERLVYSAAIKEDHPTRQLAGSYGIDEESRGEFLAHYVKRRDLIAICGSHGKSSTAAMTG